MELKEMEAVFDALSRRFVMCITTIRSIRPPIFWQRSKV